MLGALFVPVVAMILALSEYQDRALQGQEEATEFYMWVAGRPVVRTGAVHSHPRPGCMGLRLNDSFPLGAYPVVCGDILPVGTRLRVLIVGHGITMLEVLRDDDP